MLFIVANINSVSTKYLWKKTFHFQLFEKQQRQPKPSQAFSNFDIKEEKGSNFYVFIFFPKKTRRGKLASEKFELLRFWINRRTDEMECVCASVRVYVCLSVLLLWVCEWEWLGNRNLFEDMNWAKGEMFCVEGNPEKLRNFYFSSFFPSMDKFLFLGWESLIWNWFSFHLSFQ